MKIIMPPERFKADGKFTIFLAGSIEMGKAEQWQTEFCDFVSHHDINILNPRRTAWDSSWEQSIENPIFREQVEWELRGLSMSNLILMYLQPGTMSPISMLELGLYANSNKMVVCCPEGFWRKGNIDVVCYTHPIVHCDTKKEFFEIAENIIIQHSNAGRK